jgi:hypothetical protein
LAYLGNRPAESYASFETETFSVSATANYTLSHAVTNENEIRLVINGVVQQPGSGKAYTASGTTLTLTSATVSGDVMYAVYLGRALQTVNPPNASVGTAQLADSSVTSAKLGTGATNTPAFFMKTTSTSISNSSLTKIPFDTATIDTDSAVDTTNNRFTVPSGKGGKYNISYSIGGISDSTTTFYRIFTKLYKNGSDSSLLSAVADPRANYGWAFSVGGSGVIDLNAGDYIEVYAYISTGNTAGVTASRTWLSGNKLIGA